MSLTRVVKDPGYLTQNDISSVTFANILTVWQQKCIIHTYSIKKNVLNHKCAGFLMVVMFSIFLEYLHLTPPPPQERKKNQEKKIYMYKIRIPILRQPNILYQLNEILVMQKIRTGL